MAKKTNPVIIFGAGHIGRVALEIFLRNDIDVYGFLVEDKKLINKEINDMPILETSDSQKFIKLIGESCDAFIAFEDSKLYDYTLKMLVEKRKVAPVNAISAETHISNDIVLGYGNMIMPMASLLPHVKIGNNNVIGSGAIIGTSSQIDNRVSVGQHVSVGSNVKVGNNIFIGDGAVIVDGINIEDDVSIGAGSVVINNLKKGQKVFGNPAKVV